MLTNSQKKILKLLAINCRYTNKDIAKSVGISEDAVRYQINKLIHKQKISKFVTTFDYKGIGYDHHHYLIRIKDIDKVPLKALKEIDEITFINTSYGKYDIQLIILHKSDEEFIKVKGKIDDLFRDNIVDSMILKFYYQFKYSNIVPTIDIPAKTPSNPRNPIYKLNRENWRSLLTEKKEVPKLSEGEKKTIKQLLENPRASYTEMGKRTGQSYETVRQQVRKFIEKKFIGNFGIFHHFSKYDNFINYFLINIPDFNRKEFLAYVDFKRSIFYAAELIGKFNVILYVSSSKPKEFHKEINDLRRLFKDKIIDIEMLSFENLVKSVQFPIKLLEN